MPVSSEQVLLIHYLPSKQQIQRIVERLSPPKRQGGPSRPRQD